MNLSNSSISQKLATARPTVFSSYCIIAAFSAYFCMYAFRKPFTAGTFEDTMLWGIGYKTILLISQVLGYTLSKFIGIKIISEMPPAKRGRTILALIAIAHFALLLFALIPPPWNFVFLFMNGLPLGMVFGLVLSFLEGRQVTEALAAGLCASFIVSSGVVKSVGSWLMLEHGVTEYWMPFLTGLIFIPPLIAAVWMLRQIPPPSKKDIAMRSERLPMSRHDRSQFFWKLAPGLCLLFATYILITILRSFRDDFAVEIWKGLGESGKPAIFAQSETAVMLGVMAVTGAAIMIKNNRRAFLIAIVTIFVGLALVCVSTFGFQRHWFGPMSFMILTGLGLYIPYVAFHTTLFERLIAVFREKSNLGYLMYIADAVGYLGYVVVMLLENVGKPDLNHLQFFIHSANLIAVLSMGLMAAAMFYFHRKMPHEAPVNLTPDKGPFSAGKLS